MRPFWVSLAFRELRGGLAGFRVFLACLLLGVGGIAAVGSATSAIRAGLAAEGREILGGDVSVSFTYRFASDAERAWLAARGAVSEVVDFRSMLGRGEGERALAQVKGVDGAYPLLGEARLSGDGTLAEALAPRDGIYGLVAEPVLAGRLGLAPGDHVSLGGGSFEFRGVLEAEPDQSLGRFALGPRALVLTEGLHGAGMLGPGTLFSSFYRLRLDGPADLAGLKADFTASFPEAGARWRDRREPAPGIERFVNRMGAFLVLTGLASLAVGGVGIGAAVKGYIGRKTRTIAVLRAMGATAGEVFAAYSLQVGIIALLGVGGGVALGAGLVGLAGPLLADRLPVPVAVAIYPAPLLAAALYGALVAALCTFWPLAQMRELGPAALFRSSAGSAAGRPRRGVLAVIVLLVLTLAASVVWLSGARDLALWVIGSVAAGFLLLRALGWALRHLARRSSRASWLRRRPGLRLALGAIGAPGGQTGDVVVALGLGLGVLAAIGQIDANLQRLIREQLPEGSPAFFFVDIQSDQLERFRALVGGMEGVGRIDTAPMLRGVITHLDGVPAAEAKIDPDAAWVLRGDRGVTYAAEPPRGARLVEGAWWPPGYSGPPLVSFAEEEARELGLHLGSTLTVNVLGRPLELTVANFREVEWRGLGINFLMVLDPAALAGAPHGHIATVHAAPAAEAAVMRAVARELPNVTAIRVREQVDRVAQTLTDIGAATRWAATVLLATGLVVLVGAAGAAAEGQTGEAAILKVLGAGRGRILASFALRAVILGAAAGLVALAWGMTAGWAATRYLLDAGFAPAPGTALAVVAAGTGLSLAAGLAFAWRPLRLRPAAVLRQTAG